MDVGNFSGNITTMNQFLGDDNINTSFEKARVVILPVPVEFSTSYGKGTAGGPQAILEASAFVELYDEELNLEIWREGIHTLEAVHHYPDPPAQLAAIRSQITSLLSQKKYVVTLGGEHSISAAVYAAFHTCYENLSVLQLDAHSDLRMEYEGSLYSHASVMRRIWEQNHNIVPVGIRAMCREEREFVDRYKIPVYYAHQLARDGFADEIIDRLTNRVYLTFDVDFFDPSIMPSTGTPEPGGFLWYETLEFLLRVFQRRQVVGFDVVELSPQPGIRHPDFLVAKLISKLIGFHIMESSLQ
jgi:agmatinase